jgi:hypothetical protein
LFWDYVREWIILVVNGMTCYDVCNLFSKYIKWEVNEVKVEKSQQLVNLDESCLEFTHNFSVTLKLFQSIKSKSLYICYRSKTKMKVENENPTEVPSLNYR